MSEEDVNAILLATTPNIGFYIGATALAIVAPRAAAFGYLLIAIFAVLRTRESDEAPPAPGASE